MEFLEMKTFTRSLDVRLVVQQLSATCLLVVTLLSMSVLLAGCHPDSSASRGCCQLLHSLKGEHVSGFHTLVLVGRCLCCRGLKRSLDAPGRPGFSQNPRGSLGSPLSHQHLNVQLRKCQHEAIDQPWHFSQPCIPFFPPTNKRAVYSRNECILYVCVDSHYNVF